MLSTKIMLEHTYIHCLCATTLLSCGVLSIIQQPGVPLNRESNPVTALCPALWELSTLLRGNANILLMAYGALSAQLTLTSPPNPVFPSPPIHLNSYSMLLPQAFILAVFSLWNAFTLVILIQMLLFQWCLFWKPH